MKTFLTVLVLVCGLTMPAHAQDKPRAGGELIFVVAAEPPSFDAHQEETFAMLHPGAPQYSTLMRVEPQVSQGVPHWRDVEDSQRPSGMHVPEFLQHFGMKFAQGTRPFTGTPLSRSKVYIRHLDPAPLSESHVVGLIDCIPPPLLQMMSTVVPASSLTWTLEFIRHDYSFSPSEWWRIDTEVKGAGDGYCQESSLVLDPQGRPAAFSRQLVAVFG